MDLNLTNLHPVQKTGELLIREGLARKEDIEAALKSQTLESKAEPTRSHRGLPSFAEMPRNDRSPAAAASPRNENWRNPITSLMMPNMGSMVLLRNL